MTRHRAAMLLGLVLTCLQTGCLTLDQQPNLPKDVVTLPPSRSAELSIAVSDQLVARGHYTEAIHQLNLARQSNPKLDVSPRLARLYAQAGRDREAISEYELAIQAHPRDASLYNDLGYFQYDRGNFAEAERALRKALEIEPENKRAWMNLGLAIGQQGRTRESLTAFEQAVKPAEARCNLAFVLGTQGKFDQARDLYREALQLDPGLKLARNALARLDQQVAARPAANLPQNAASRPLQSPAPFPIPQP